MRFLLAISAAAIGAGFAPAGVLWDQSQVDFALGPNWEQESPGKWTCYYQVNDFQTAASGWRIKATSTYFYVWGDGWMDVSQARLNVFPKTSPSPEYKDDPHKGTVVNATIVMLSSEVWELRAEGLTLDLPGAGEYWLGLTPIQYWDTGADFHLLSSALLGAEGAVYGLSEDALWEPLSWMYWQRTDSAFKIEGTLLAEPGDLNCDGVINAFDIDPFVLALTDPAAYAEQFPLCDYLYADITGDGEVDAFDVAPFVALLTPG